MSKDVVQKFVFKNRNVRGSFVSLEQSYQTIIRQHHYPSLLSTLLGEALLGICLMTPNFKVTGKMTLQFQGSGDLRFLSVNITSDFKIRGLIQAEPELISMINLQHALASGQLILTYEPQIGQMHQSIIPVEQVSIAGALEDYFLKSEQLPTRFFLASDQESVAGLMLQNLPAIQKREESFDLEHCIYLAQTLKKEELLELDSATLLRRLFPEEDILLFDAASVDFGCNCSRGRMESVVLNLGQDEVSSILDEHGFVEVVCEFCGQEHQFDENDIANLFRNSAKPEGVYHMAGNIQ